MATNRRFPKYWASCMQPQPRLNGRRTSFVQLARLSEQEMPLCMLPLPQDEFFPLGGPPLSIRGDFSDTVRLKENGNALALSALLLASTALLVVSRP